MLCVLTCPCHARAAAGLLASALSKSITALSATASSLRHALSSMRTGSQNLGSLDGAGAVPPTGAGPEGDDQGAGVGAGSPTRSGPRLLQRMKTSMLASFRGSAGLIGGGFMSEDGRHPLPGPQAGPNALISAVCAL
jgi:hypothetical protein